MKHAPIAPDVFRCFFEIAAEGDPDNITKWLVEHVTNPVTAFQFLVTVARWNALIAKSIINNPEHPDGFWVMTHLSDSTTSQPVEQPLQMLVAALNDDTDVLTSIASAVVQSPPKHVTEVAMRTALHLTSLLDAYRRQPQGSGS